MPPLDETHTHCEQSIERCQVGLVFLKTIKNPKLFLVSASGDREKFRVEVEHNLKNVVYPGEKHNIVIFDRKMTTKYYTKLATSPPGHNVNTLMQVGHKSVPVFDDIDLTFLPLQEPKTVAGFGVHLLRLELYHKDGIEKLEINLNISDSFPTKTYLFSPPAGNVEFNIL